MHNCIWEVAWQGQCESGAGFAQPIIRTVICTKHIWHKIETVIRNLQFKGFFESQGVRIQRIQFFWVGDTKMLYFVSVRVLSSCNFFAKLPAPQQLQLCLGTVSYPLRHWQKALPPGAGAVIKRCARYERNVMSKNPQSTLVRHVRCTWMAGQDSCDNISFAWNKA